MQRKDQTTEQDRRETLLRKLRQLSDNYDRLLKSYDEILHETWPDTFESEREKTCSRGRDIKTGRKQNDSNKRIERKTKRTFNT